MISNAYNRQFTISTNMDLEVYFDKSLKALHNSNYNDAIYFINLAIDIAPKKEFYMFQKVKIFFVSELYDDCAEYIEANILFFYKNCSLYIFSQILSYYHLSTECSVSTISQMLSQNNIPTVIAVEFESIMDKNEIDFLEKASFSKENGDYNKCIHYCNLLVHENNDSPMVYKLKARCHYLLGHYEASISTYKKAITLKPNDDEIYHDLGIIMMELQRYPDAISYFLKSTNICPHNIEYKSSLGNAFYKWKKYDSALKCFKQIIAKDSRNIDSFLNIAEIYAQINQPKKAKKYYRRAIYLQKKYL